MSSFCIRLQAPGQSVCACLCDKLLQSCPTLCDPIGCGPPGSSIHGILWARILDWIPCPPPGDLPDPGIESASLMSPALAGRLFTISATWEDYIHIHISSVQFSRSVLSDSVQPHESQHTRPPCPSLTLGVHSDSRPSSQ